MFGSGNQVHGESSETPASTAGECGHRRVRSDPMYHVARMVGFQSALGFEAVNVLGKN